jgi:hypothetical protein
VKESLGPSTPTKSRHLVASKPVFLVKGITRQIRKRKAQFVKDSSNAGSIAAALRLPILGRGRQIRSLHSWLERSQRLQERLDFLVPTVMDVPHCRSTTKLLPELAWRYGMLEVAAFGGGPYKPGQGCSAVGWTRS